MEPTKETAAPAATPNSRPLAVITTELGTGRKTSPASRPIDTAAAQRPCPANHCRTVRPDSTGLSPNNRKPAPNRTIRATTVWIQRARDMALTR